MLTKANISQEIIRGRITAEIKAQKASTTISGILEQDGQSCE
jgi:hypothetical protein